MHKMPRIWIEYLEFLILQKRITKTRHTFDRAIQSLPITQHTRIWKLYTQFAVQINIPETAIRIFKRYLKLEPENVEEFISYLLSIQRWDEAAVQMTKMLNNETFNSKKGKTKHKLWVELCELLSNHPDDIVSIRVEPIIRGGIKKFTDQVGQLWCCLAQYYIRLGNFEKSRDVFEEGMNTVLTIRDFSQIWDAYTKFEDKLIAASMEFLEDEEEDSIESMDFDLRVARYEYLIDRQPLLVSSVLLRQNPHNVNEWLKRVTLVGDNKNLIVETFTEAIKTVDCSKATGKPYQLWVGIANFYEEQEDLDSARKIYEKGVGHNFKWVEDLSNLWCHYAEMELRHNNYDQALGLLKRATVSPKITQKMTHDVSVQQRLHRSTNLWTFYADLEESIGTFYTTKAVYDKIIDMKIATPKIIMNYATFLESYNYFEDSFQAYEKGVTIFKFPYSKDLWITYLTKFVKRYGGKKIERARDLFEQVLNQVPPADATMFYILYANLEQEYGLARRAMNIYDRASEKIQESDRYKMYLLYIVTAAEYFGVTKTRKIFENAIQKLPDKNIKDISMKYAELELRLGEIDRARSIYTHGSQFCDPKVTPSFWDTWYKFEVKHGNEDTFREMLRIKRSVQAKFTTDINFYSATVAKPQDDMEQLEIDSQQKEPEEEEELPLPTSKPARESITFNPEEMEIDDEEEEDSQIADIQIKAIPKSLYSQ